GWLGLCGWLVVCFLAAAVGAMASVQAPAFYAQLHKPDWAPPAAAFGPVWSLLYALMGVAAWRVWRCGGFRATGTALALFLVQLAVNALWSWVFFVWHLGLPAFVHILLLWLLVAATLLLFWRISRLAGALLLPYLLWISFAAALCGSIWQLNPQLLG
ncbi:MAG TPA: TspO/MBR family protein, partial [Rhodocyclaceae bacterium]|nr:TspO/MBR family protein [Rhodocyclaceae bacterium]